MLSVLLISIIILSGALAIPLKDNEATTIARFPLSSAGALVDINQSFAVANHDHFDIDSDMSLDLKLTILYQLVTKVQVGSPPQFVSLALDSSIAYSFIPSVSCTSPSCTGLIQNAFNKSQSSTFYGTGKRVQEQIGDYVVTMDGIVGELAQDVISIGDKTFTGSFILADNTISPKVSMLMYHGRLGLGYPYSSDPSLPSLMPGLFSGLERKMYSVHMNNYRDYGVIGSLDFGTVDMSMVDLNTWVIYKNYIPQYNYWSVHLDNLAVGGLQLGFNGLAIVNLASPFITLPYVVLETLAQVLKLDKYGTRMKSEQAQATYYKVLCENSSKMKSVTLDINGIPYLIGPETYLIGNGKDCVTIFYGHDIGEPIGTAWVLGNSFFRGRMVAFDYDNDTISWGNLKA